MTRWLLRLALLTVLAGAFATAAVLRLNLQRQAATRRSDGLIALAQEMGRAGRPRDARGFVEQALVVAPWNPRAHRELAMHSMMRGETAVAIAELRFVAAAEPENAGALRELGVALAWSGDRRGAIEQLRRAADLAPTNGLLRAELAHMLLASGEAEEALETALRAVAVSPRIPQTHFELGLARSRTGDDEGALRSFQRAAVLDPREPRALVCAAAAALKLERWSLAHDYAERARRADPNDADARALLDKTRRGPGS